MKKKKLNEKIQKLYQHTVHFNFYQYIKLNKQTNKNNKKKL